MRKGFTLIELLVVIAIIAILAAILFPVFAKARKAAMTTKCLVHGQEIGKAMISYMDDYDGRFPSEATGTMLAKFSGITWKYHWPASPPGSDYTWGVGGMNQFAYVQLAKYVRNTDIWICPSAEGMYSLKYARGYRNSWFFNMDSFGYDKDTKTYANESFTIPDGPTSPVPGRGIGQTIANTLARDMINPPTKMYGIVRGPSQKIFGCCFACGDMIQVEAYSGGPVITPSYPHNDGSIYVYCDGHAKWKETGRGWAPVNYSPGQLLDRPHNKKS